MGVSAAVLALSTLLQFVAAGLAVRLVWVTKRRAAWLLIAAGVFLMAVRRSITLTRILSADAAAADLAAELVALVISVAMVAGIALIAPYFRAIVAAREKVKESEQRLQAIIDNSPSVVYLKGTDGRYSLINRKFEELFDVERESIAGKTDVDIFPKDTAELFGANDRKVLVEGNPVQFDERAPHPDGTIRDYVSVKFPLRHEDGEIYAIGGISTDITERIEAERQQRDLEANMLHIQKLESLGLLAGGIAHDFNNLLVPIMAAGDLVAADLTENQTRAAENLRQVQLAAERAAELCKQLLAYSGRGKFMVEALDVSQLVRDMAPLLDMSAKSAIVSYELAANLPSTKADATQLQQILMNLVVNASEAVADRPMHITVKTGCTHMTKQQLATGLQGGSVPDAGEIVFLEVSDTGTGMDEPTLARLFEPFFTTKFTGRGLGLSAAMGIVRAHAGSISVESEIGKGTRIRVMLPASDESVAAPRKPSGPPSSLARATTVLVVDDEEIVRRTTTKLLEAIGCEVIAVDSGRAALQVYRKRPDAIDAVLLDMTMPGMDGKTTLRELRKHDADVRVVLTSGYSEHVAREEHALERSVDFLQKPYNMASLDAAIRKAIAS